MEPTEEKDMDSCTPLIHVNLKPWGLLRVNVCSTSAVYEKDCA